MERTGTDLDVSDPLIPAAPYTSHRLLHASPEHLYLTSRRAFIGPIPHDWLKSHREDWYKHHFHLNYSSKAATFRAQEGTGTHWRTTGLDSDGGGSSRARRDSLSKRGSVRASTYGSGRELLYQASLGSSTVADDHDDAGESDTELALEDSRAIRPTADDTRIERARDERDASPEGSLIDDAIPLDGSGRALEDHGGTEEEPETTRPEGSRKPHIGLVDDPLTAQESYLKPHKHESGKGRSMSPSGAKVMKGTLASKPESLRRIITENTNPDSLPVSSMSSGHEQHAGGARDLPNADASTSSLLQRDAKPEDDVKGAEIGHDQAAERGILAKVKGKVSRSGEDSVGDPPRRRKSNLRFDLPEDLSQAAVVAKARMAQMDMKRPLRSALRRRTGMDGQIIKMEKMLVRVDITQEKKLPDDYDENGSQGIVTTTLEKWREFMVVCRQGHKGNEEDFVLQIYKTRVIPAIEKTGKGQKFTRELPLDRRHAKVNLYSSLDKSVVVWVPDKRGTKIIILRPATTHSGVEWYTFLRHILGWHRATQITVSVPDLSVSLTIENPFQSLETKADDDEEDDESIALEKATAREQIAAKQIIDRCIRELKGAPQWADVIEAWTQHQRVGLAWKRYDRLEWIYGVNEKKMYGTIALMKYMDLELRAKEHYPTDTKSRKGKSITEPPAVEGFLVRLTNQKGTHQRMGKLFSKRLYFHTHDQYLFYSRPAKADPPPPPRTTADGNTDDDAAQGLPAEIPLMYAINPYPVEAGEIVWLRQSQDVSAATRRNQDEAASDEYRRKVQNVCDCDGLINLCDVERVRDVDQDTSNVDEHLDSSSDAGNDSDRSAASDGDNGGERTLIVDASHNFELVLSNGLVVRLQAFNKHTKNEWKKRLRALIKYWKRRHLADVDLIKAVRRQNLKELDIDEETEAVMGQFGRKWEVTKSFASPTMYNMCGISCCRTVHHSGPLFFKPRLHKLFTSVQCVLIPGRLLLFETIARSRSGRAVPHIHHERVEEIDLQECYLYSGLLTENDLLYQNQTFDSNSPGHHALPRMWLDEGWTSRDEDVMCCFVLWRPLGRGWFKSPRTALGGESGSDDEGGGGGGRNRGTRLKRVTKLGATGRSSVFRARTRVERDHWVLALAAEIERVKGYEDVRITEEN